MFKQHRVLLALVPFISLSILLTYNPIIISGQPTVKLIMEPPDKVIRIGSDLQQIWIFPRTNERNVQFEWKTEGPGEFKIEEGGVGGIYNVPDKLQGGTRKVAIAVTIVNNKGETATDSVTFTLEAIAPTPTPTPVPISIRQVHLKDDGNSIIEPTYSVKPGESVTIIADITKPSNSNVTLKYSAIYGKIVSDQQAVIYTAPNKPGGRDIVTVKVVDITTGKLIFPQIVKIEILGTPR